MTTLAIHTSFAAKEAKNNFGRLLDVAQREPVRIQKNGRDVAVLLSLHVFEQMEAHEDAYWGERAKRAMKRGSLGTRATKKYIDSVLHAE